MSSPTAYKQSSKPNACGFHFLCVWVMNTDIPAMNSVMEARLSMGPRPRYSDGRTRYNHAAASFFLASSLGELSDQDQCFQGVEVSKMALSSLRAERNSIQNFCASRSSIQHVPRMTSQNSKGCMAGFGKDCLTWGVASANRS